MTEVKRRNLLGGLTNSTRQLEPAPTEEAVAQVAARHGIAAEPQVTTPPTINTRLRRERKVLGRTHQFNVRLHPSTVEKIYAEANGRNIPIAQVIEEAMALLRPEDH